MLALSSIVTFLACWERPMNKNSWSLEATLSLETLNLEEPATFPVSGSVCHRCVKHHARRISWWKVVHAYRLQSVFVMIQHELFDLVVVMLDEAAAMRVLDRDGWECVEGSTSGDLCFCLWVSSSSSLLHRLMTSECCLMSFVDDVLGSIFKEEIKNLWRQIQNERLSEYEHKNDGFIPIA